MPQLLYAIPFALEDRGLFADFSCGDEPWSLAAAEWIQGSGVETSVTHYGTKVWLFRRDSDDATDRIRLTGLDPPPLAAPDGSAHQPSDHPAVGRGR